MAKHKRIWIKGHIRKAKPFGNVNRTHTRVKGHYRKK